MLVLLFVALCFILRGDLFYGLPCVILFLCFSPFSIAITSLGEERSNLSAFRTFVRFVIVWFCLFPLPLCVWEGLRFVIVALPGLFSYPFLTICLWLGPPWFIYWFSFTQTYSSICAIVALPGRFFYLFLTICLWLGRRGSTIGFHLHRHTVELTMSTRLCLL